MQVRPQAAVGMTGGAGRIATLSAHPSTPSPGVQDIVVRIALRPDRALALTYSLLGDLRGLRLPAGCAPRRRDGLWRHTCFEAFVGRPGGRPYSEFNFAPSGEWAAYAFRGYREPGPPPAAFDPQIAVRASGAGVELAALIPAAALPRAADAVHWRLGLSAVLEHDSGALSYWALAHPGARPDFHHPASFALELAGH